MKQKPYRFMTLEDQAMRDKANASLVSLCVVLLNLKVAKFQWFYKFGDYSFTSRNYRPGWWRI